MRTSKVKQTQPQFLSQDTAKCSYWLTCYRHPVFWVILHLNFSSWKLPEGSGLCSWPRWENAKLHRVTQCEESFLFGMFCFSFLVLVTDFSHIWSLRVDPTQSFPCGVIMWDLNEPVIGVDLPLKKGAKCFTFVLQSNHHHDASFVILQLAPLPLGGSLWLMLPSPVIGHEGLCGC